MTNPLLVLNVHVEIAPHHKAATGADTLLPAAELTGFHVTLHDVHAILLVEGYAGDFIEADHVVLANQSALAVGIVDEHARDRRFASGDQVGIRRYLLEQVTLAGASRAKLHHVVIALHERNHAQQHHVPGTGRELLRLHADAANQETLPLLGGEFLPALIQRRQHFALR